jgi:hypothetical protein
MKKNVGMVRGNQKRIVRHVQKICEVSVTQVRKRYVEMGK